MVSNTAWAYTFDLKRGSWGFTDVNGGSCALQWFGSSSWQEGVGIMSGCKAPCVWMYGLINRVLPCSPFTATRLTVVVASGHAGTNNTGDPANFKAGFNGYAPLNKQIVAMSGPYTYVFTPDTPITNVTSINLGMLWSVAADGVTCDGSGVVTSLTVEGLGPNPFLDHYCAACAANYLGLDLEEAWDALFG